MRFGCPRPTAGSYGPAVMLFPVQSGPGFNTAICESFRCNQNRLIPQTPNLIRDEIFILLFSFRTDQILYSPPLTHSQDQKPAVFSLAFSSRMALAPALQIHSATLFDSFSRLQPPRLRLLRRSSSTTTTTKKLTRFTSSLPRQNPQFNPTPPPKPTRQRHHFPPDDPSPKPSWLLSWSRPRSPFHALPKRPPDVLDYRHGLSSDDDEVGTSRSTGSSTMQKIVDKLKKFGYIDDDDVEGNAPERDTPLRPERGSVEDVFYIEDGVLPDARGGLSLDLREEVRFPWEKPAEDGKRAEEARRKKTKTSLAELTLPEGELRRLRHLAIRTKSKRKIGGAGVTREVVDLIHEKWRTEEVVRLKCEGPPALNMKRMHEILEVGLLGLLFCFVYFSVNTS